MASVLRTMTTAVHVTSNAQTSLSARYQANAAEELARLELENLLERNSGPLANVGGWNGRANQVPLDQGLMTLTIEDNTDCFNVNSLVSNATESTAAVTLSQSNIWPDASQRTRVSLRMQRQFIALLEALEFSRGEAERIAASVTDWIDTDAIPSRLGVEDGYYTGQKQRYRTANQLIRSVSEILAVRGITKEVFERLEPYVCAHPTTRPNAINVNLLGPDDAALIMMLAPRRITRDAAQRALASVPATGWDSASAFWSQPALNGFTPDSTALSQTAVTSGYFILHVRVEQGGVKVEQTALFQAALSSPRRVARTWQNRL